MYSPITSPDETTDAEQALPPTVQGCCSPAVANDPIVAVQRVLTDMAVARTKAALHESYSSAAVAADPIVGIDRLLSEVAATHVVFHGPPPSPGPPYTEYGCSSVLQESAVVVLDIATTSDRPLTIGVLEDDDDTPPPPPPPQPHQADDVSVMRAAYELKADRVRYINTDLKMMPIPAVGWRQPPSHYPLSNRLVTGPGRLRVQKCRLRRAYKQA